MENKKIVELQKQILELKSQWPKHSVPPAMLQQLDELEEELENELKNSHEQKIKPETSEQDEVGNS